MIFDGSVTLPRESTAFAGSDLEITASEDGAPSVAPRRWVLSAGPWCAWSRHADHNLCAAPLQQEPEQRELQVETGCLGRTPDYSASLWYLESSWTRQNDSSLVYSVPYYCCHDEFASWKLVPSVRLQIICVWKDCGSVCWSNVPAGLRWGQV